MHMCRLDEMDNNMADAFLNPKAAQVIFLWCSDSSAWVYLYIFE